ncbi:MAG: hypothetical protein ACOX6O_04740 [Christensenellales bacterium]
MIKLDQLPQVADETLGGLKADLSLLYRAPRPAPAPSRRVRALAMAFSVVLVVGLAALIPPSPTPIPQVTHYQAGVPLSLPSDARSSADLPRGSLVLSQEERPAYQGVWARGSGGNFPLIRLDGRFYRLLSKPDDVSAIVDCALGQVALHTAEPALDRTGDTLSSVVSQGDSVYAIPGMAGGAVAAPVDGKMRAFQRVSFAGSALVGAEALQDTLPPGAVTLQLSGVGTVSEPDEVSRLMDILFSQAVFQGSQLKESKQALLIQYPNGLVLQMAVSGSSLSACGTWSCPAFFEAFGQFAR